MCGSFDPEYELGRLTRGDSIHRWIRAEVQSFRVKSFENYQTVIAVQPLKTARGIFDRQTGKILGGEQYLFEGPDGLRRPLQVRVEKTQRRFRILVYFNRDWNTITKFLTMLQVPSSVGSVAIANSSRAKELLLEQQGSWWALNGKSFRLLDLPSEIRETVYAFALRIDLAILPFPSHRSRRLGKGSPAQIALAERLPNVRLLLSNKQVYMEASHVLYSHASFRIQHKPLLSKLVRFNLMFRDCLRQLELSLPFDQLFETFGYDFGTGHEDHRKQPSSTAPYLRLLSLKSLSIVVPPPGQITTRSWLDDACQVKMVECLFEAAWPWIRGHPFKFVGFLKSHQKSAFEARGVEEMKQVEAWQQLRALYGKVKGKLIDYDDDIEEMEAVDEGGVNLDDSDGMIEKEREDTGGWQGAMASITQMPPRCRCSPSCTLDEWTAQS